MGEERFGTPQKAIQINEDRAIYGTFAEIGAGQEVARWFFRVGRASGTVAKTMSAYDMEVSDAIYGPAKRYVSRARLQAMLEYEYGLLLERLNAGRGDQTRFFVFADTVATSRVTEKQEGRGWLGIRFQHAPRAEPSDIILHVRLLDSDAHREQETLGVLGVNLIHGAFFLREDPTSLIRSLMDDLSPERLHVTMIKFTGPAFAGVDNRLMSLQLVEQRMAEGVMFRADGEVVQPSEILHEKPLLVVRGSFRPITNPTLDMLERARARFAKTLPGGGAEPVVLMEMSLANLLSGDRIDHADFLARVDILSALGRHVMITNHARHYALANYLRRYTRQPTVFAIGVPSLREILNDKYYTHLDGGLLEGIGKLFKAGNKLCVYPAKDSESGDLVTADNLPVEPHIRSLYAHLRDNGLIEGLEDADETQLHILPRDVLAQIQSGVPGWEKSVPAPAAEYIRKHGCFGHIPTGALKA